MADVLQSCEEKYSAAEKKAVHLICQNSPASSAGEFYYIVRRKQFTVKACGELKRGARPPESIGNVLSNRDLGFLPEAVLSLQKEKKYKINVLY